MKKSSIRDIAARAGVCPATVSRALSNPDIVSEATRKKVLSAVEALDYTPDKLAAGLKQGNSRNIVVMLPDITNLFFNPIVRAIERVAFSRNYSVLIGDTMDEADHEVTYGKLLFSRQADGVIITSQRLPFDLKKLNNQSGRPPPIVSTAEVVDDNSIQKCSVDNVAVGKTATEHLLSLGHRRIAVICGPRHLKSCQDRMKGFLQAMQAAGLRVDEKLIEYGDYSTRSGSEATTRLLHYRDRPSAIFCFGDMVAFGALHCLYEAGFKVPTDMSVMGVDGISMGEYSIPALTTVAQPISDIGTRCAENLLDIIEGRKTQVNHEILKHTLVERKSTSPPPSS